MNVVTARGEVWTPSFSAHRDFKVCERFGELRHRFRVEKALADVEGWTTVRLGHGMHAGIAQIWRDVSKFGKWDEGLAALQAAAAHEEKLSPEPATIRRYAEYLTRWHIAQRPDLKINRFEVLGVEEEFTVLGEFTARVDLRLRHKETGEQVIVDWKCKSSLPQTSWLSQWDYNEQLGEYLGWVSECTGEKVRRAVVGLIVPSKDVYTWDEVRPYSDAMVEEFKEIRRRDSERAKGIVSGLRTASPNTSSCYIFNKECEFMRVCHADPAVRESVREAMLAAGELEDRDGQRR